MTGDEVDIRLLRGFEAIAKHGGLGRAARAMHLTQPALSLQLKKLEDQLGMRLFEREPNRLVLTAFGQALLKHAESARALGEAVTRAADDFQTVPTGELRIGSYTTATSYFLAPIVSGLTAEYPGLVISFDYSNMAAIMDKVRRYELDCAVMSEVPPEPHLDVLPLFEDRMVLAATKRHYRPPLRSKREIAELPYLMYPVPDEPCYRGVFSVLEPMLHDLRVVAKCENFETLKQLVLSGAGVSFLPAYMIASELKRGRLKEIVASGIEIPIQFSFVTRVGATLSAATTALKERTVEAAAERDRTM